MYRVCLISGQFLNVFIWVSLCLHTRLTQTETSENGNQNLNEEIINNGTEISRTDCLFLTPFIRNGSAAIARRLSEVIYEEFLEVESYSGFITVNDIYNSNIFFWYFPASGSKETNSPWIIWLQGGLGASSMIGVFYLHGPFVINGAKVSLRNTTWTENYSVLYIDNPVGAGFSFTDNDEGYTTSEEQVSEQLLEFLRQFLEVFPELRARPLFLAGESYAGKYVPALGRQIHSHRHQPGYEINLKGLIIGNGLIDPRSMLHYSELLGVLGLLDEKQIAVLKSLETKAVELLDAGRMVDAANKFNETLEYIKYHSAVDIMNFNQDSSSLSGMEDFLQKAKVSDALHVGNVKFDLDNQYVYRKMLPDFMNTTKPYVEEMLEHYGVLCYSGQLDLMIPYWGSKHMYSSLKWSGRDEYKKAKRARLRYDERSSVIGYKKSGGNFTEVLIRGSGHMVPRDQPRVAKHMLDDFILGYTI